MRTLAQPDTVVLQATLYAFCVQDPGFLPLPSSLHYTVQLSTSSLTTPHPCHSYGSALCSEHCWLATLHFRPCALQRKQVPYLGNIPGNNNNNNKKQNNLFEGSFDDTLIFPTSVLPWFMSPYLTIFPLGKLLRTKRFPAPWAQPTLAEDPACGPCVEMISVARLMKSTFNSMAISTPLLSIYIFNIWLAFECCFNAFFCI